MIETLEPRQFLSAAAVVQPNVRYLPSAASSSAKGYSPAEIASVYGFSKTMVNGGTAAGTGAGQTIAIVDAYDDPNLRNDLAVFDQHFGLNGPPVLKIVSQTGTNALPATDPGWAGEISLDVEWAHAMAPQAGILLVEASSASTPDLLAAADYARKAGHVSVVSMSWGGSEFVGYTGSESATQLAMDKVFTTPAGHNGVTFVASAGDSGFGNGVQWPASAANVVSVGGTTLKTDSTGADLGETAWRGFSQGTSGGLSQYEPEPAYQKFVQHSGFRSSPDVAYNADVDTGFAVYDSVPYFGASGWQVVGGTSAGAPQWAALIAIADQGRALAHLGTLDGVHQTLPALYSIYSGLGTSNYSTYTSYFNPIGSGAYGLTTGLGSPKAAAIVTLLGGNTAAAAVAPVSVSFATSPPSMVIGGSAGSIIVRLKNGNAIPSNGALTIKLSASTDGTLSTDDVLVTKLSLGKVKLAPQGARSVTLKFKYPAGLTPGSYSLIASASATPTGAATAQAASPAPIAVVAPVVELATAFASGSPITVVPGKAVNTTVTIANSGNVAAIGTLSLSLYDSADQILDLADKFLTGIKGQKISIAPGHSTAFHLHFVAPAGLVPGTYSLIASATAKTSPADADSSNNLAFLVTA